MTEEERAAKIARYNEIMSEIASGKMRQSGEPAAASGEPQKPDTNFLTNAATFIGDATNDATFGLSGMLSQGLAGAGSAAGAFARGEPVGEAFNKGVERYRGYTEANRDDLGIAGNTASSVVGMTAPMLATMGGSTLINTGTQVAKTAGRNLFNRIAGRTPSTAQSVQQTANATRQSAAAVAGKGNQTGNLVREALNSSVPAKSLTGEMAQLGAIGAGSALATEAGAGRLDNTMQDVALTAAAGAAPGVAIPAVGKLYNEFMDNLVRPGSSNIANPDVARVGAQDLITAGQREGGKSSRLENALNAETNSIPDTQSFLDRVAGTKPNRLAFEDIDEAVPQANATNAAVQLSTFPNSRDVTDDGMSMLSARVPESKNEIASAFQDKVIQPTFGKKPAKGSTAPRVDLRSENTAAMIERERKALGRRYETIWSKDKPVAPADMERWREATRRLFRSDKAQRLSEKGDALYDRISDAIDRYTSTSKNQQPTYRDLHEFKSNVVTDLYTTMQRGTEDLPIANRDWNELFGEYRRELNSIIGDSMPNYSKVSAQFSDTFAKETAYTDGLKSFNEMSPSNLRKRLASLKTDQEKEAFRKGALASAQDMFESGNISDIASKATQDDITQKLKVVANAARVNAFLKQVNKGAKELAADMYMQDARKGRQTQTLTRTDTSEFARPIYDTLDVATVGSPLAAGVSLGSIRGALGSTVRRTFTGAAPNAADMSLLQMLMSEGGPKGQSSSARAARRLLERASGKPSSRGSTSSLMGMLRGSAAASGSGYATEYENASR